MQGQARALLALFGASDAALIDLAKGAAAPEGKLPFELPRSMQAVAQQNPALPNDSAAPLYPAGWGLRYRARR